jgi:hypothetical protein
MISASVGRTPTKEEEAKAEERRLRLNAALAATGLTQTDLHHLLVRLGDNTSLGTINRWINGKHSISELALRGLLTVMGLDAEWKPGVPVKKKAARA